MIVPDIAGAAAAVGRALAQRDAYAFALSSLLDAVKPEASWPEVEAAVAHAREVLSRTQGGGGGS